MFLRTINTVMLMMITDCATGLGDEYRGATVQSSMCQAGLHNGTDDNSAEWFFYRGSVFTSPWSRSCTAHKTFGIYAFYLMSHYVCLLWQDHEGSQK